MSDENKLNHEVSYKSRRQGGYGGHAGAKGNMDTEYAKENPMDNVIRHNSNKQD